MPPVNAKLGQVFVQLRSLVRGARKDASGAPDKRNGRAYRELFQFIRQEGADG